MRKLRHGGQFKCPACGDHAAQCFQRCGRLRLVHDAFDNYEADVIARFRPIQPRVPNLGLPFAQSFASRRAIAEKVGLSISGDGGGKARMIRRNSVNGGIGKARHRHHYRVERFFHGFPFRHDCIRHFLRWQRERIARWCLYRTPVEADSLPQRRGFKRNLFPKPPHESGLLFHLLDRNTGTRRKLSMPTRNSRYPPALGIPNPPRAMTARPSTNMMAPIIRHRLMTKKRYCACISARALSSIGVMQNSLDRRSNHPCFRRYSLPLLRATPQRCDSPN